MRARIQDRLISTFWTNAEVNDAIDNSLRVWNALTGYFKQSTAKTISGDTIFYDLEANLANHLSLLRIELAGTHLDLLPIEEKDNAEEDWQDNASGTTVDAMPLGLNLVALDPAPSGSTSYTIVSVRSAELPSGDSANIQIGEEDMAAIVDFATFELSIKEGGQEMADNMKLLENFLLHASKYNSKLNTSSAYRNLLGAASRLQRA